jgi:hypothetical protein
MTDIVWRLRALGREYWQHSPYYNEAADVIEWLRAIRHKPAVGGPPCPTCGFVITHKKAEPSRYEDER